MKLFKLKRKNIILVSFLAIAGFLAISSVAVNQAVKETPVAEKAEAITRCLTGNTSDLGNWNASANPMSEDSGGNFYITKTLSSGNQFKVTDGSWDNSWGSSSLNNDTDASGSFSGDNGNIKCNADGTYTIVIDSSDNVYIYNGTVSYQSGKTGWVVALNNSGGSSFSVSSSVKMNAGTGNNYAEITGISVNAGANFQIAYSTGYGFTNSGWKTGTPAADSGITKPQGKDYFCVTNAGTIDVYGYDDGGYKMSAVYHAPTYTVSTAISPSGYGTVSPSSLSNISSGTSYSVSNNVLTVGSNTITATPAAATEYYIYSFSSWSVGGSTATSGTITGNTTFTANFTRSTRTYTITFNQNDGSGYSKTESKTAGVNYTIPSPEDIGMGASGGRHFLRWNTASGGGGTTYNPGDTYSTNAALNLHMIQDWCTYEYSIDGGSSWHSMTRKTEGVTSGYVTEYYNSTPVSLVTGDDITFRRSYGGGDPYSIGGTLNFENNYDSNGVKYSGTYTFYLKITSDGNNDCYVPGSKTTYGVIITRGGNNLYYPTSSQDGQYVTSLIEIQSGDVVKGHYGSDANPYPLTLDEYSQGSWSASGPTATAAGVYKFYLKSDDTVHFDKVYIAMNDQASAIFFAQNFNSTIGGICKMDGSTNKSSLTTAWGLTNASGLYKNYSLLTDEAKDYLVDASENEDIIAFFQKYDYVLSKYGTGVVGNFLGRTPASLGAYRNFSLFGSEDNFSTIIIIISSSVALLSVTALSILVIRKRKSKED